MNSSGLPVVVLAVLLMLPSITAGLLFDDYSQKLVIHGHEPDWDCTSVWPASSHGELSLRTSEGDLVRILRASAGDASKHELTPVTSTRSPDE